VLLTIGGTWQTYKGALSPVAGVSEPKTGVGPYFQDEFYAFSGNFTPGSMPIHGKLPSVNVGGTKADILKGDYANQTGNPLTLSQMDRTFPYFNNYTNYSPYHDDLAWTYQYLPTCQNYCGFAALFASPPAFQYAGDVVT
jgi:hypothetical protein